MTPSTRSVLNRAYQTALAALLAERIPDGYWVGELSTSALSTATAVSALALVQQDDRRRTAPSRRPHRRRRRVAGGPSERRRRLGRYGQELQQHLHHHALPRRVPPHRDGRGALRRLPAPGRRLAGERATARRRRNCAEAVRAPLRQGPHLLGADPHDQRPGRAGVLGGSAVAAVRAGLLPAVVVSLPATPGCQLRLAGAHRHRPGGVPPSAAVEPGRAAGAPPGDRQEPAACWRRSSRPAAAFSKRRR